MRLNGDLGVSRVPMIGPIGQSQCVDEGGVRQSMLVIEHPHPRPRALALVVRGRVFDDQQLIRNDDSRAAMAPLMSGGVPSR